MTEDGPRLSHPRPTVRAWTPNWRRSPGRGTAGRPPLPRPRPKGAGGCCACLPGPAPAPGVPPRPAAGRGPLVVAEPPSFSGGAHAFGPDSRRIRTAIANLAPGTPVLATTATANARVCADVADQLGDDVLVLRGPLDRESLHLGVVRLESFADRLAWIAGRIPPVPGTGIVYCLTVAQTDLVASYLRACGIDA